MLVPLQQNLMLFRYSKKANMHRCLSTRVILGFD